MIIDQLPLLGGDVQGTDEFPIERGTTTYKATLEQIFATVYSAIEPNFAGAYDSTATYSVGDYVVHSHKLYRCTTAITTAEAWTAAHWTQVDVAGELSAIYSGKQDTLISGMNIKTVGGQSLLGSGNIAQDFVNYASAQSLTTAQKQQAKDNIAAMGKWVLLWENANTTSDFAQQTIPIDLSAYDAIVISFKISKGYAATQQVQQIVFKGYQTTIFVIASKASWRFASPSSLGVEFSSGIIVDVYGTASNNNSFIIPCMIYGIKGVQ